MAVEIPRREKKTKEDILAYMKQCAKQYVPEWRFDEEHPDAGTALASLFADMMSDNIRRFNLSSTMDMLAFFDDLGAKLVPARPAEGYITFGLPEGYGGGEEVPAGTGLLAETAEEPLVFETGEEVLVRHMDIQKVYLAQPEEDAIYEIYDRAENDVPSFSLFRKKGDNLQAHCLYCCFDQNLKTGKAAAKIFWKSAHGEVWDESLRDALSDSSRIRISYGTVGGYREIRDMKMEKDGFCFTLEGGENGFAPREEFDSMYVIRFEAADTGFFSGILLSGLKMSVSAGNLTPDLVHADGTDEEKRDNILVFGEAPAVYNEFYLASEEVLGKTGADIRVEFDLDFVKIPLEDTLSAAPIQWKMIMRKQTFVPDQEYDITIREVAWEYFNGYGWTRLQVPAACQTIFTPDGSGKSRRIRLEFTCPDDIRPTLVSSAESFCIRARILKMNNAFKLKGSYVVPVAGQFFLSYDYASAPFSPAMVLRQNNMEIQRIGRDTLRRDGYAFRMCDAFPDRKPACYLGFEEPLAGGPLRMLFVLKDAVHEILPDLAWEYMGKSGFRRMHLTDGTRNFHHTGLISWFGSSDSRRSVLFGQELFWIRIVDESDAYRSREWAECKPGIEGIYPNSTVIRGIESMDETYYIDIRAEEKKIQLPYTDLADLRVDVLERAEYRDGALSPAWETWTEVSELSEGSEMRREFAADRCGGTLFFPKYMRSIRLTEQEEIEIRVRYTCCRGAAGNVGAGMVNRLNRTVGFINSSFNPIATSGGTDREKVLHAVGRNAKILRHRYRCVSARDYEDMAREAVGSISRIRCFSGYDENRKRQPGAVTLVVLPEDYEEETVSFERMKERIFAYLSSHMDENIIRTGKFHIVKPRMIKIDVRVCLSLTEERETFAARRRIIDRLDHFLDPVDGNFYGEGWEIGVLPDKNQILYAIKGVEGVRSVRQLTLRKYQKDRAGEPEFRDDGNELSYLLPESGRHEIIIDM